MKYQLLLSFAGLLVALALAVYPPTVSENFGLRKQAVGSIFSILCILGVLAAFSPSRCGKVVNRHKDAVDEESADVSDAGSIVLRGHHPSCGNYSAHTFQIGEGTFCAACVGLLFGGLLALAGAVVYFFCDLNVSGYSVLFVFLGCLGVGAGLFQFKFRNIFRLLANTVFVLGALLILIGIDAIVRSIFFDLFVVCLIVFWLSTRVSLSKMDHEIVCSGCRTENCWYREQKKEVGG